MIICLYKFFLASSTIYLIFDSIFTLYNSTFTYQQSLPFQNMLYLGAYLSPLIINPTRINRKDTIHCYESYAMEITTVLLFLSCCVGCIYTATIYMMYFINKTPPPRIVLVHGATWTDQIPFRVTSIFILLFISMCETIHHVYIMCLDIHDKESRYQPLKETNKKQDKCQNGYMFIKTMFFAISTFLVVSIPILFNVKIWQQFDSPHVIILACGMNSIPRDKYYIAAYMTIFTIGIAHSIIYVYREIDRVGNISDWTGDYIDIFNMTTGNSVIIDDLYSFKGLDMSFIYSFTLWSMIHHVIHACLVSVSIAIYFSVFIIIFSQKNGN